MDRPFLFVVRHNPTGESEAPPPLSSHGAPVPTGVHPLSPQDSRQGPRASLVRRATGAPDLTVSYASAPPSTWRAVPFRAVLISRASSIPRDGPFHGPGDGAVTMEKVALIGNRTGDLPEKKKL